MRSKGYFLMKGRRFFPAALLGAALLASFSRPSAALHTDEIAAPYDKVWQAAYEALKPYGIRKANRENLTLESRWIEDRVTRSRGLLSRVAPKQYLRRYRFRIQLEKDYYSTHVKIGGTYQEKSTGAPPSVSWRTIRPEREEYQLERDLFMQILSRLEAQKMDSAS